MAITVTTRAGKGSPLTNTEMDTNLTNLARSATTTQEGNIEIATTAEVTTGTDTTRAVTPAGVAAAIAASAFSASISGTAANGSITIGDFILKWIQIPSLNDGNVYSWTTPFPSACFGVVISMNDDDSSGQDRETSAHTITVNGFTTRSVSEYSGKAHFAIGIGN